MHSVGSPRGHHHPVCYTIKSFDDEVNCQPIDSEYLKSEDMGLCDIQKPRFTFGGQNSDTCGSDISFKEPVSYEQCTVENMKDTSRIP